MIHLLDRGPDMTYPIQEAFFLSSKTVIFPVKSDRMSYCPIIFADVVLISEIRTSNWKTSDVHGMEIENFRWEKKFNNLPDAGVCDLNILSSQYIIYIEQKEVIRGTTF